MGFAANVASNTGPIPIGSRVGIAGNSCLAAFYVVSQSGYGPHKLALRNLRCLTNLCVFWAHPRGVFVIRLERRIHHGKFLGLR